VRHNHRAHVRFGSLADMSGRFCDVRFTPKSGYGSARSLCPLCAVSGHCPIEQVQHPWTYSAARDDSAADLAATLARCVSSFASSRNSSRRPVPRRQTRPMFRAGSSVNSGRVIRLVRIDRQRRQQCGAKSIVDHLDQGRKARRLKLSDTSVSETA
jgi:hypothetical protein